MQAVQPYLEKTDNYLKSFPLLVLLEQKVAVKYAKVYAATALSLLTALSILVPIFPQFTSNFLTLVFPLVQVSKGFENSEALKKWLTYYFSAGFWILFELSAESWVSAVPFYWAIKVGLVYYLCSEDFHGYDLVYSLTSPHVKKLFTALNQRPAASTTKNNESKKAE